MFTYELLEFIKSRDYYIGGDDLLMVINTQLHPQIDHIKYNPYEHFYEMWDREGNYIKFYAMPVQEAERRGLIKVKEKSL